MDEYLNRSFIFKAYFIIRTLFNYHFFFKKKFTSITSSPIIWGIWNVEVVGPNISMGKNVVIVGANDSRTRLNTIRHGNNEGSIKIGDNVLVMNGVRISSASSIIISDDCMLANFCYITDADWHGIHNRTRPIGRTAPIILEKGVWIGDSAIICKGVRIGENSIIGAGSVVRTDIPANVIAFGNPAKVVKSLDPEKVKTMGHLYEKMGR